MKEVLLTVWRKEKAFSNGVMERFMKATSKKVKWQDRVLSIEVRKKFLQAHLWTTKKLEKE